MIPNRPRGAVVWIALLALAVALLAPLLGAKRLDARAVVTGRPDDADRRIFLMLRLPRVALSFLVGAALAASGAAFQALFRNALAEPFTLGVSSGASFGAAVYVRFLAPFIVLGFPGVAVFAFMGAMGSVALVYGLARARKGLSTATMLLAGVAVNFFFSSAILVIQYTADFAHSFRILRWLMGRIDPVGPWDALNVLPVVVLGAGALLFLSRELDVLTTGEDLAAARGVDVAKVRAAIFVAASLMVAAVVASCGPIGFVGLMVPHAMRLVAGHSHARLLPASLMAGGAFLTLCDALARTAWAPLEFPVGVVTALLGGPFFLWLLLGGSAERSVLAGYDR